MSLKDIFSAFCATLPCFKGSKLRKNKKKSILCKLKVVVTYCIFALFAFAKKEIKVDITGSIKTYITYFYRKVLHIKPPGNEEEEMSHEHKIKRRQTGTISSATQKR